jgi:cobalamin-dependent methionine synthase I
MELEDKGIYSTHSFSPGQNNIPMDMQTQIFQVLKPEEIGVTLNDKFMMHPKKSVSGIFGMQ